MQKILDKLNFKDRKTLIGFLSVVTAGQLIYSSFEAFKGTFYNLLLEVLNVSNAELGAIFGLIGISIFFYIPGGWINNRFSIKSILIVGLLIRFITISVIIFFSPTFQVLKIIAIIWGIVDSFFWPAVLNGVIFFTDQSKRGMGFGLLESVRRAEEMLMNLLIVGIMSLVSGIVV
ncbi:MFS transporter, partial [Staphylococcus pseudintermedius]